MKYSAIEAKASNVLLDSAHPETVIAELAYLLKRVRRRKVMNGLLGRKAAHALFLLSLCLSAPLNAMAEPATADRGVAIHSLNAPRSAILLAETKAGGNATGAGGGATVAAAQGVSQLSLQDLMALAVRTHPSVGAKKADANAAEYDVQSARWQYFPTPSVSARQDGKNGTTTVVAVQQPLWAGGRIDAGYNAAMAKHRSSTISIVDAQQSIALNVATAYQAWAQSLGRMAALGKSVRYHEEQTQSMRRRVDGGVSASVDLDLVESRLAQVQGDYYAAQAAGKSALAKLSQAVGRPLAEYEIAFVVIEHEHPSLLNKSQDTLVADAEAVAPALKRLDADIEAASHEAASRRAAIWPTIGVRAESQRVDSSNTNTIARTDNRIMLTLDLTPGAGLSAVSGADAASARALGLRETKESARRELVAQVIAEYQDYLAAVARRKNLQQSRRVSAEVLSSYSRLFVAGKKSWLDVMNSARELTQAEIGLSDVNALIASSQSRLRVYLADFDWFERPNAGAP